jgi:hypothetical protein
MECRLDINKINEAVQQSVKDTIESDQRFEKYGNNYKIPIDFKEGDKIGVGIHPSIDQGIKAANTLDFKAVKHDILLFPELYFENVGKSLHETFKNNTSEFLKKLSKDYYDGILNKDVDEKIYKIANELFPYNDIVEKQDQIVKEINSKYGGDILYRSSPDVFSLRDNEGVNQIYLFSQPESSDLFKRSFREFYINHYPKNSPNLISNFTFIDHPILEDVTHKRLIEFLLSINPNFKVIKDVENLDSKGLVDLRDFVILLRDNNLNELPEEVAHVFFELLPDDNPLKKDMLLKIIDFQIYRDTYEEYKNKPLYQKGGRADIDKIKREAVAKLISKYINDTWNDVQNREYTGWLEKIIDKIIKFLRKVFTLKSGAKYIENVKNENPFIQSANMILSNDSAILDKTKVFSTYDSIFLSALEEETPEFFKASRSTKMMFEFTRELRKEIIKINREKVERSGLDAIKEAVKDPINGTNILLNLASYLEGSNKDLNVILDAERENDTDIKNLDSYEIIVMYNTITSISASYNSLVTIPQAMRQALDKIKLDGNENDFINSIKEVQLFKALIDSLKGYNTLFTKLLDQAEKDVEFSGFTEELKDKLKPIILDIEAVDIRMDEMLRNLISSLLNDIIFSDKFNEYVAELEKSLGKSQNKRIRERFIKLLEETITSKDQLLKSLSHFERFAIKAPSSRDNKITINESRIKDIGPADFLIATLTSPSLVGDPIISNLMKLLVDNVVTGHIKGQREAITFAKNLFSDKEALMNATGLGYYELEKLILAEENFYSESSAERKYIRRVFIDEINSFKYNYDENLLLAPINELEKEIRILRGRSKDFMNPEIEEKVDKIRELKKKLKDFYKLYREPEFKPAYFDIINKLDENIADEKDLKELKKLNRKIIQTEERLNSLDIDTLNPVYESFVLKLINLQAEAQIIKDRLPKRDAEYYDLLKDLYEEDVDKSEQLRLRHKNTVVNMMKISLRQFNKDLSNDKLNELAEKNYEKKYIVNMPNDGFYQYRTYLYEQLAKIKDLNNMDVSSLTERIQILDDKRKEILSEYRNASRRKVNVQSFKYARFDDGTLVSDKLKEIELEMDTLRKIIRNLQSVTPINLTKQSITIDFIRYNIFLDMFSKSLSEPNDRLKTIASDVIENITDLQLEKLKLFAKSIKGDQVDVDNILEDLDKLGIKFKSDYIQENFKGFNYSLYSKDDITGFFTTGLSSYFKEIDWDQEKPQIDYIYTQLDNLQSKELTYDYYLVFKELSGFIEEYLEDDSFQNSYKEFHQLLYEDIKKVIDENDVLKVDHIGELFADHFGNGSLFQTMLRYLRMKSENLSNSTGDVMDPDGKLSYREYVDFLESIHKPSKVRINDKSVDTFTPLSFNINITTERKEVYTQVYPKFLTKNKIKDDLKVEKIDHLHPDVISGKANANIDINGKLLPKRGTKYEDERYKNLPPQVKTYLNKLKTEYLKQQVSNLEPGRRPYFVVPFKRLDHYESNLKLITDTKHLLKTIKSNFPGMGNTDEYTSDLNQELETETVENPNIYTGLNMAEESAKINSLKVGPIEQSSIDSLASVIKFIEEANEAAAKDHLVPVFDAIVKEFTNTAAITGANENRAKLANDISDKKLLDKASSNLINNKDLAKFISSMSRLAVLKMLFDPIGGMINWSSGQIANFVGFSGSKSERASFISGIQFETIQWTGSYIADLYTDAGLERSLTTQLIQAFNMVPDRADISKYLSKLSTYSDLSAIGMIPRQHPEYHMAITVGRAMLKLNKPKINGVSVDIKDLYELKDGLIQLKPQFQNLKEDWDPINGKMVKTIRGAIMQKYTLLQGNFYKELQSMISYNSLGKAVELMKRWFFSGMVNNFQGEIFDPFLEEARKGSQRAIWDALSFAWGSIREGDLGALREYYDNVMIRPSEKVALTKAMYLYVTVALLGLLLAYGLGYDNDDPDKNKRLRESTYWKKLAILIAMRVQGEAGTFIPLPLFGLGYSEIKRGITQPLSLIESSSISNLAALGELFFKKVGYVLGVDSWKDDLYYKKEMGYDSEVAKFLGYKQKDGSKITSLMWNTLGLKFYTSDPEPYIKSLSTLQNRVK